jgi:tRNA A-37 threonylcarbamoyl transferase component Bud32
MDYDFINHLSLDELKQIAEELKLEKNDKKDLKQEIINCFREYEDYNKKKIDLYQVIRQIGNEGKDGVTYLVKSRRTGEKYAMKTFSKRKSVNNIKKEANLQEEVSKFGICPKVIEVDLVNNFIIMECMKEHLIKKIIKQKGDLTEKQQKDIIELFKKLDEAKVFHGDANLLNYMYDKNDKLCIIDFGLSKKIDQKLIKKLGTSTPNYYYMTLGFVLKLKETNCLPSSYQHILEHVSEEDKKKFNF